jgi:hypothetical protein
MNNDNIPSAYRILIGHKFSALEFEEQAAARLGMREGHLKIEPGTRIVRSARG